MNIGLESMTNKAISFSLSEKGNICTRPKTVLVHEDSIGTYLQYIPEFQFAITIETMFQSTTKHRLTFNLIQLYGSRQQSHLLNTQDLSTWNT